MFIFPHLNCCFFLCVAGLFPCTFQSSALYPPTLVLHHHLQCGQTPDEEQTFGKGKLCWTEFVENKMMKHFIFDG